MRVESGLGSAKQVFATGAHRKHVWPLYNRYTICDPLEPLLQNATARDGLAWDSLLQLPFATTYNLNRYAFAWTDERRIHPSNAGPWGAQDADLKDATVIILSASGKNAVLFAYQLRRNRPAEFQPREIIGVGSAASKAFVEGTEFYDSSVLYADDKIVYERVCKEQPSKVVIFDFGAREGGRETWNTTFSPGTSPDASQRYAYTFFSVGGEVKARSPEEVMAHIQKSTVKFVQVNASELREKGIAVEGEKYFHDFYSAFNDFKSGEGIKGLRLQWNEGMESWERAWEAVCKDQVDANAGLVFQV